MGGRSLIYLSLFWKCGFWLSHYFEAWPGSGIGDMHTSGRWEDCVALLVALASFFPQVIIIGARLLVLPAKGLSSHRAGSTWKEPWLMGYNFFSCLIQALIGSAPMFSSPHRLAEGERALWFSDTVLLADNWEQLRDTVERAGWCSCPFLGWSPWKGWCEVIQGYLQILRGMAFEVFSNLSL